MYCKSKGFNHIKTFFTALFSLAILFQVQASCIFSKPIEAKELEVGNMISWSTTQEINNKLFQVEKSTDGINFEMVGEVEGAGNSINEQNYRYLDISTGSSKSFYRIKQVDFEGKAGHTHTVMVDRQTANNFVITSMTSTLTDKIFTVTLDSELEEELEYQVVTLGGKVMKDGLVEIIKGSNIVSIDLEGLPNKKYEFQLIIEKEIEKMLIKKVSPDQMPKIDYALKKKQ